MFDLSKIDLSSVLSNDFLKQYTNFSSFEDFKNQLPVDLSNIDLAQLNQFIAEKTPFGNIEEMVAKATSSNLLDGAKDFLGKLF